MVCAALSYVVLCPSLSYQSTLTLRQSLEKDSGNYTIVVLSSAHIAQFSFTLKVKGENNLKPSENALLHVCEHAFMFLRFQMC